jgi:prophage regulatory protein
MTPHGVIAMTKKRFLSKVEVRDKIKLSYTEIGRRVKAGTFPKPLRLGAHRTSRTVWWEHEVDDWMDGQG